MSTVGACGARHAATQPDRLAFVEGSRRLSWARYHERSDLLAGLFADFGLEPGDRLAVLLPDTPTVHVAFLAAEKAGLTVVGIGTRAGQREVDHLLTRTKATAIVTAPEHADRAPADLAHRVVIDDLAAHRPGAVVVNGESVPLDTVAPADTSRHLGPDDLFMLNSTSGTTGLPKIVMHHERRWFYFHEKAVEAGALTEGDVFMSAIPAPFGFGLWTAHFTPAILGVPCVLTERFNADAALDVIERERVTVLCCVSSQFVMLLNAPSFAHRDLSSLRCLFTGGEAVPYEAAAAFEDRTGATLLQFFGSNETGALSRTTLDDTRDRRLRTAGKVIPEMHVRLYDEDGVDVTGTGQPGRPAGRGPALCLGYFDDDDANRQLYTADGWMLMGDLAEIDAEGYLRVIGRTSDFIIRGGKNISAPAVEDEVSTHPAVALAAAVAMPDRTLGERVCVYVELVPGQQLTLDDLTAHLATRGVSKEWFPERLIVVGEIPRSSGSKVAKGELRADIQRRVESEANKIGGS